MSPERTLNRLFLRNISLLLAVNLLVKPLYILAIDAQVQNQLGENEYGVFFSLFNFCMLFQIILDPGILNYNTQLIAKETNAASQHFRVIAGSKILLIVLYAIVVLLLAFAVNFPTGYYQYMPGLLAIMIFSSINQYLRSHFAALGKYNYEAWFSGLDKLLMIIIIGYILYFTNNISIQNFIYGQVLALLLTSAFFLFLLNKQFILSLSFSFENVLQLVRKTFPYALVLLLMTIYTRIDGVMLERLLDDQAYSAGVYARGFRLLDGANMIGIMFASLMLPMFAKLIGKKKELTGLVEEITRLLFVISFAISILCWFYKKEIIDLIYIQNTEEHYRVFGFLMIGFLAMSLSNIFGCLFLASEKLKAVNWLFATGILLNVCLNYLLIPHYGAVGAAITTLATQFYVFIGQFLLARRIFSLRYSRKTLAGVVIIVSFGLMASSLVRGSLAWSWYIEILLISFLMMLLAFLCGFLRFGIIFKR